MHRVAWTAVLGGLLAGCATTASMDYGALPNGMPLVRLMVTTDRAVVEQECDMDSALTLGRPVYGCRIQKRVPGLAAYIRAIKIVRWTDAMPGDQALEIEAHELCHTVAGLQTMGDPCHAGNSGMVMARRARRGRGRRKGDDLFDDGVEMPRPPGEDVRPPCK